MHIDTDKSTLVVYTLLYLYWMNNLFKVQIKSKEVAYNFERILRFIHKLYAKSYLQNI